MLRKDTRVAAPPYPPLSLSLIHSRDIQAASRWISVAKSASHGKSEKDALQLAKMSSPPPCRPAVASSTLLLNLSPSWRAFAHPHADFPLSFDGRTREWIGSTANAEGERLEEEGEEEE